MVLGSSDVFIGGTHLCKHQVMAVACAICPLEAERESLREELRAAAIAFERISLVRSASDKTITAGEALVRIRRFLGE